MRNMTPTRNIERFLRCPVQNELLELDRVLSELRVVGPETLSDFVEKVKRDARELTGYLLSPHLQRRSRPVAKARESRTELQSALDG